MADAWAGNTGNAELMIGIDTDVLGRGDPRGTITEKNAENKMGNIHCRFI